jgi:hypothetical protein
MQIGAHRWLEEAGVLQQGGSPGLWWSLPRGRLAGLLPHR